MSFLQPTWRIGHHGDSITRGDFSASASWLDGGGPLLRAHFVPTINPAAHRTRQEFPLMFADGVAGWTWLDWAGVIDQTMAEQNTELDLVSFPLGINDALFIHTGAETIGDCENAIAQVFTSVTTRFPSARIAVATPWNAKSPFPSIETEILAVIAAELAAITALGGNRGRLINWHDRVPMVTAGPGQNTVDGVHCNQLGARQLGAAWVQGVLS